MSFEELPLFPLNTVLVPGGVLQLRIFEARYLDLVRACGRSGQGFGVCLLLGGAPEAGPASQRAGTAAFGTEALISDFSTLPDGLLGLVVTGARRFRVMRTRVRDNGLVVGDIEWLPEVRAGVVRPEHGLLATLLARIAERAGGALAAADATCFDDAAWIGWRLTEHLPISHAQRQQLLQEPDPHARLDRLVQLLPSLQPD